MDQDDDDMEDDDDVGDDPPESQIEVTAITKRPRPGTTILQRLRGTKGKVRVRVLDAPRRILKPEYEKRLLPVLLKLARSLGHQRAFLSNILLERYLQICANNKHLLFDISFEISEEYGITGVSTRALNDKCKGVVKTLFALWLGCDTPVRQDAIVKEGARQVMRKIVDEVGDEKGEPGDEPTTNGLRDVVSKQVAVATTENWKRNTLRLTRAYIKYVVDNFATGKLSDETFEAIKNAVFSGEVAHLEYILNTVINDDATCVARLLPPLKKLIVALRTARLRILCRESDQQPILHLVFALGHLRLHDLSHDHCEIVRDVYQAKYSANEALTILRTDLVEQVSDDASLDSILTVTDKIQSIIDRKITSVELEEALLTWTWKEQDLPSISLDSRQLARHLQLVHINYKLPHLLLEFNGCLHFLRDKGKGLAAHYDVGTMHIPFNHSVLGDQKKGDSNELRRLLRTHFNLYNLPRTEKIMAGALFKKIPSFNYRSMKANDRPDAFVLDTFTCDGYNFKFKFTVAERCKPSPTGTAGLLEKKYDGLPNTFNRPVGIIYLRIGDTYEQYTGQETIMETKDDD